MSMARFITVGSLVFRVGSLPPTSVRFLCRGYPPGGRDALISWAQMNLVASMLSQSRHLSELRLTLGYLTT